jgi:hypothetical protein
MSQSGVLVLLVLVGTFGVLGAAVFCLALNDENNCRRREPVSYAFRRGHWVAFFERWNLRRSNECWLITRFALAAFSR